ncbi:hypothetical protein MMC17_004607 [Xylographa soralifera]|nr:hypothetical protein [Xylographa soralifera]
MATLLYPPFAEKPSIQKRWAYASILTDIVRGSSDAIDAFTLFHDLLHGKNNDSSSVGFMGFDAHGGDTGCQLRAGMLQEVFSVHRRLMLHPDEKSSRNPDWIDANLKRLRELHRSAKEACAQLTQKKAHPKVLGFGDREDSVQGLLKALGWSNASVEPLYGPCRSCFPPQGGASHESGSEYDDSQAIAEKAKTSTRNSQIKPSHEVTPEDIVLDLLEKVSDSFLALASPPTSGSETDSRTTKYYPSFSPKTPADQGITTPASTIASSTISSGSSALSVTTLASSASSISEFTQYHEPSPLQTEWNLLDSQTLVRFIVYSYILSKYKVFCRLSNVVGARISPETAVMVGERLIQPYFDPKNRDYKPLKMQRYRTEFATYQAWISDFSCAWLRSLAARSIAEPNLERLMTSTIQKSSKDLTAMACYPGYLLLREAWAQEKCTMILIDRHFCPFGYHVNLYYATLRQPISTAAVHPDTLGQRICWTLQSVTTSELLSSPEQSVPHLIVMGNSIEGTYVDYFGRIPLPDGGRPENSFPHELPSQTKCAANEAHNRVFTATDHDRLTLAFFASHKSYAFPLESGMKEQDFVEGCMDEFEKQNPSDDQEQGLKESWRLSTVDADEMGTSTGNFRVFGIQHMALETKARVARLVQVAEDEAYLLPLRSDVPV